jgi:hypothetical protein
VQSLYRRQVIRPWTVGENGAHGPPFKDRCDIIVTNKLPQNSDENRMTGQYIRRTGYKRVRFGLVIVGVHGHGQQECDGGEKTCGETGRPFNDTPE